jgi:hypothetical protein
VIEHPKTPAMNKFQIIKTASRNSLYALALLSLGAAASPAQEVNQGVGQSINGIDAQVHADVTGQATDQAGSRSRSQATSPVWAPTRTTTPSVQPAIPANSSTRQPVVPPIWTGPVHKTADTSAKGERRIAVSNTNGAGEPGSRFTPTFGHLGGTPSTIGAGLRSTGHSTQGASGTRKHLSQPSASHRKTRAKLQLSRGTRRVGS